MNGGLDEILIPGNISFVATKGVLLAGASWAVFYSGCFCCFFRFFHLMGPWRTWDTGAGAQAFSIFFLSTLRSCTLLGLFHALYTLYIVVFPFVALTNLCLNDDEDEAE